jgi:hypothetical protein
VGLLARILVGRRRHVRRLEQLSVQVPLDKADRVRDAVEHWLRGKGIGAAVTTEEEPNGKVRIRAKLGEADAAKLDLSADAIQSEFQDVLSAAIDGSGSAG